MTQQIQAPSTLLAGEPGVGKTWSLTTYMEEDLDLFVIITDPGGVDSLLDSAEQRGVDLDHLHWRYIPPAIPEWDVLKDMATKISVMSYKDLTEIKSGVGKAKYKQFFDLLQCCSDFQCDHCDESFGAIETWDDTRAFAIDSLSGVNIMAMDLMIGAKPAAHQGEWGVAMNAEEKLILKLTSDLSCFFALTAHLEREPSELEGIPQEMAAALGRRLAPKLPRSFGDVVKAYREGDKHFWSTAAMNVALKNRSLSRSDKLEPSFVPIVKRHRERKSKLPT